jgi:tRNA A37 threonylcarbamoyladenosine modification protein TsaB
MYKIHIDSVDRYKKTVTLSKDGKKIAQKSGEIDLVGAIKGLLEEHSINIKEVEFEANPGPGSFTGIKIGVTVANVLNWVSGRKNIENLQKPRYGAAPNIHKTPWLEK